MTARGPIHLGFEIRTGEPVAIPRHHLVVTGLTQVAGKTTTIAALIQRSHAYALAFVTKRGEIGLLPPRCCSRRVPSRSCSRSCPIRSAAGSSPAFPGRAATSRSTQIQWAWAMSQASPGRRKRHRANHPVSRTQCQRASRFSGTQTLPPTPRPSRRWRRQGVRSECSCRP
jgi:hypothetical protein